MSYLASLRGALAALVTTTCVAVAVAAGPATPSSVAAPVAATTAPGYATDHHYLVVSGFGTPLISSVQVDRSGQMSLVPGSPQPTSVAPLALAITPDGRTAYSTGTGSGTITVFHIGVDGVLTPQLADTVVVGTPVVGAAISPDGSRLFITTGPTVSPLALGTVRSFAIAPSGHLTPTGAPAVAVDSSVSQVAIAPDGRHLVVSNYVTSSVVSFTIGSDASLTQVGVPLSTGAQPVMPAFTPDGRYLYLSNESGGTLSGYAISGSGDLTPIAGSPFAAGQEPHGAVISPDGTRLYVPDSGGSAILGYGIGADGGLTPLAGSPYATPGLVGRVLLSADGQHLYAVQAIALDNLALHSHVTGYLLDADGRPVRDGYPSVDTGIVFEDGSTAYLTPDQGPVAALRLVGNQGSSFTFSAAESVDPDGRIASYRWTFGDGTTSTTSDPSVSHRFRGAGDHRVTVTVVDDEGCSTELIYEGTTVLCRGGSAASTDLTVHG